MMDSAEPDELAHRGRSKDSVPSTSNASSQGDNDRKLKKASKKRSSDEPKNHKAKKRKLTRVVRPVQPGYTVHEGEDMLLVISSSTSQYGGSAWVPKRKGGKRKKLTKGKGKPTQTKKKKVVRAKPKLLEPQVVMEKEDTSLFVPEKATDHRWGQRLPEEVLINIFHMVVAQDGAVPFLCR